MGQSRSIIVGLVGCPVPPHWVQDDVRLVAASRDIAVDGMIAWGSVTAQFLSFRGPKVFYSDEPLWFLKRQPWWPDLKRWLRNDQVLHHSQADPGCRIPSVTHYGALDAIPARAKLEKAVAVVSNFGGRAWWLRGKGIRLRNRFVTHPKVDLFGNRESWAKFRRFPWSMAAPPANFKGPLPGSWLQDSQIEFLGRYKVAVCLENAIEDNYFTEKFVNVVRAGSIPIYHASTNIRREILAGARWIDPADYRFDPDATIEAALATDADEIRIENIAWLATDRANLGNGYHIWNVVVERLLAQRSHA